jgi:NADPH2:quinone reductase
MAEEAVADAIHVMPVPEGLPLAPAVALPISYPTAAAALLWRARLAAGDWVLVQGAAGRVVLLPGSPNCLDKESSLRARRGG